MYFLKGKRKLFISLKGNGSEDASCPVNVKNVQVFPYAAFVWLFCQYLCKKNCICVCFCCLTSTEVRRPISLLGTGMSGKRGTKE